MRQMEIYRNGILAGILTEENPASYIYEYNSSYFSDSNMLAISLTLPKTQTEYRSEFLFPFFFNMLSEGVNRELQCRQLKIDKEDDFAILMSTAQYDTIGAITVKPITTR